MSIWLICFDGGNISGLMQRQNSNIIRNLVESKLADQNWRFFVLWKHGIWQITLINNRAFFLCYFKLCASYWSHWWIQTGVTTQKRPVRVEIDDFQPCDHTSWRMTLKNNGAPLLSSIKLCASFQCHMWIQTRVTGWKRQHWVLTGELDL